MEIKLSTFFLRFLICTILSGVIVLISWLALLALATGFGIIIPANRVEQNVHSFIQNLNSEWAHMNSDGSWDINFGVGNDQEIADKLGIDVEAVQAIMRKLSDYGFEINLDEPVASLEELKSCMDPTKYVGRSVIQVEEFLTDVIAPILEENKDIIGMKAEINV